jgi:hypothetical protein
MSKQFPKHQDYNKLLLDVTAKVNKNNAEYHREVQLYDQIVQRIASLVSTGDMVEVLPDTGVKCANGHEYDFRSFQYQTKETITSIEYSEQTTKREVREWSDYDKKYVTGYKYDTTNVPVPVTKTYTTTHFGCPACKSTIVFLASNRNYKLCKHIFYQPKYSLQRIDDVVEDFTGCAVMIVTLGIVPGIVKPYSYIVPEAVVASTPQKAIQRQFFIRQSTFGPPPGKCCRWSDFH